MITAFLLRYWKPLAGLALILAMWGTLAYWGHTKYAAGVAAQKSVDQKIFDKLAALTEKTKIAVAARESQIRDLLQSSNKAREEGIAHAVEEQQRIVAGVRDGSLRLRREFAGCQAANSVSDHAAPVGASDDAADLRATGAGDLIRALDDADVQVAELQRYALACQANGKKLE